jgi:hypothetical protein
MPHQSDSVGRHIRRTTGIAARNTGGAVTITAQSLSVSHLHGSRRLLLAPFSSSPPKFIVNENDNGKNFNY